PASLAGPEPCGAASSSLRRWGRGESPYAFPASCFRARSVSEGRRHPSLTLQARIRAPRRDSAGAETRAAVFALDCYAPWSLNVGIPARLKPLEPGRAQA